MVVLIILVAGGLLFWYTFQNEPSEPLREKRLGEKEKEWEATYEEVKALGDDHEAKWKLLGGGGSPIENSIGCGWWIRCEKCGTVYECVDEIELKTTMGDFEYIGSKCVCGYILDGLCFS